MGFSMACNQATRLTNITGVVEKRLTIGMGEGTTSGKQYGFWSGHVPILWSTFSRQGDVQIGFPAKDRGHFAADTADRMRITEF